MSSLREQFDVEADAISALGDIDAALAHVARKRRTWLRAGLATFAAAAALALLALGVRPLLSNHDPAVGPTTTQTPSAPTLTPTPTVPPSPLSVGAPVVRGDSAHHRSYAIFMVENTSAWPLVLARFAIGGSGSSTPNGLGWDAQLLTAGAGDLLVSAPAAARFAIATDSTNEPSGTLSPGDRIALVVSVINPCTTTIPDLTGTTLEQGGSVMEFFAFGMTHYTGPSAPPGSPFAGPYQTLLDFGGTTPAWLTTALRAACPT